MCRQWAVVCTSEAKRHLPAQVVGGKTGDTMERIGISTSRSEVDARRFTSTREKRIHPQGQKVSLGTRTLHLPGDLEYLPLKKSKTRIG